MVDYAEVRSFGKRQCGKSYHAVYIPPHLLVAERPSRGIGGISESQGISSIMDIYEFLLRMGVALGLGILLGLDREIKRAPVGIRTYALVCVGAAVYTMLTLKIGEISAEKVDFAVDPSRLIQGLIGGIGFLGAGAIIGGTRTSHVRGIASGAAIWVSGGIGVACGLGFYWEAVAVTVVCAAVLFFCELAQVEFGERDDLIRDQNEDEDGL